MEVYVIMQQKHVHEHIFFNKAILKNLNMKLVYSFNLMHSVYTHFLLFVFCNHGDLLTSVPGEQM